MDEQKTVAKGTFWALLSQFAVKFIAFLYLVVVARFLPTETVGLFYLALSILGILYVFTDLGIVHALNRFVPYYYAKKQYATLRRLVRFSYGAGTLLTFVFATAVFLLSPAIASLFGEPGLATVLPYLSLWMVFQEVFDISRGILTGRKRVKEAQGLEVLVNALRLVFTLGAVYLIGSSVLALAIPYIAAFGVAMVLSLWWALQEIKKWPRKQATSVIPYSFLAPFAPSTYEFLGFGIATLLLYTFWNILQYIDRVMLGWLLPNALEPIGIYSIAVGFATLLLIFPSAIAAIFFPVISELFGQGKQKEMQRVTVVSIQWLLLLSMPLLLLMLVFPADLLGLFYGGTYAAGATVLVVFTLGLFFRVLSFLPGLAIAGMKRVDVELKAAVIAMAANIVLNYFLIPVWGMEGAAVASAISFGIVSLLLFHYSHVLFGLRLPASTLKPLVAAAITLVLLFLARPVLVSILAYPLPLDNLEGMVAAVVPKLFRLILLGVLFAIVLVPYGLLLVAFRALSKPDIAILQGALRRAKVPEKYVAYAEWLGKN